MSCYPQDNNDLEAIRILNEIIDDIMKGPESHTFEAYQAAKMLYHALCHLAKPDRAMYPKRRGPEDRWQNHYL